MLPFALLATIIVTPPVHRHRAGDSVHAEPVILDVRITTVASATFQAMRVADTAFLPVGQLLALAELPARNDLPAYLSTDTLSRLLHVSIVVDWDDLTADIEDNEELPISQRAIRERRRAQFNALTVATTVPIANVRQTPILPRGLILDYDVGASSSPHATSSSIHLGLGSDILGGSLDGDWMHFGRHLDRSTFTWERGWPAHFFLHDVRIGSIPLTSEGVIGSGVFISSSPPIRGDSIAPITLSGIPGPGWEIEAFRDDVLVYAGLTDSTGGYFLNVPASRGINRISVAAYGPHGERRIIGRYVSIGDYMIRPGTAAFDFSIGRCDVSQCDYGAALNVRYAPFSHFTVGAGLIDLLSAHEHSLEPSALVAARLHDDVNATARYSRDATTADLRYAPSTVFDVTAAYHAITSPSQFPNSAIPWSTAGISAIWRPRIPATVTAGLDVSGRSLTDERRIRFGSSFSLGRAYIQPFVSLARLSVVSSTRATYGAYMDSAMPFLLPAGSRIRGSVGDDLLAESFVSVSVPFARVGTVELGIARLEGMRAPQVTMSLGTFGHRARYAARSVTSNGSTATAQALSGSITVTNNALPGSHAVMLSSMQQRGRAEIAGTVFLDENQNGILDAAEQVIPGVVIAAGSATVETGMSGEYLVQDVVPFAPIVLVVDSLSLPSSGLEVQPVRVVPLPNGITRLDLAATRRASTLSVRCSGLNRVTKHAESGDPSPIHCDDLEPGVGDTNSVTNPRQSPKSRENVTAQC